MAIGMTFRIAVGMATGPLVSPLVHKMPDLEFPLSTVYEVSTTMRDSHCFLSVLKPSLDA